MTTSRRWYQEPYVWLLITFPMLAVVAGFYTLYLAIISYDGLVEDDYYKRGKQINRVLERDQAAASLGLSANTRFDFDSGRIVVLFRSKPGFAAPDRLSLRLLHATRAGYDQKLTLQRLPDGRYFGLYKTIVAGRWHVQLETDVWRLTGSLVLPKENQVELIPQLG